MITTIISAVFTVVFLLGVLVCSICGYATLYMSVARRWADHKITKMELKYCRSFKEYCEEHASELAESEVNANE